MKNHAAALLACLALFLFDRGARAETVLIEERETLYNTVYVEDDGPYRYMRFGRNSRFWTESIYLRDAPRILPALYTQYLTAALAYPGQAQTVLELGLGGGRLASYLATEAPDLRVDSVELDADVIALARAHFDLADGPNLEVFEGDGRLFLLRARDTYDVIILDAYRGPFVPFHLTTREFYTLAKRRLTPGGAVAQNIEPSTMLFDAALATMASVFDHVDLFDAGANVVAVAYDGAALSNRDLSARASALQARHGFFHPIPPMIEVRRVLTTPPDHAPLVDDFAPVETLKSAERHNAGLDALSVPAK